MVIGSLVYVPMGGKVAPAWYTLPPHGKRCPRMVNVELGGNLYYTGQHLPCGGNVNHVWAMFNVYHAGATFTMCTIGRCTRLYYGIKC